MCNSKTTYQNYRLKKKNYTISENIHFPVYANICISIKTRSAGTWINNTLLLKLTTAFIKKTKGSKIQFS